MNEILLIANTQQILLLRTLDKVKRAIRCQLVNEWADTWIWQNTT